MSISFFCLVAVKEYRYKGLLTLWIVLLFASSIFSYSDQFVNEWNDPKHYYTLFLFLVPAAILLAIKRRLELSKLLQKNILIGLSLLCFIEACYGLAQYLGWFVSNHSVFKVTGSFDNPAGFASTMVMGYTMGCHLCMYSRKIIKVTAIVINTVLLTAVIISNSRAGILITLIVTVTTLIYRWDRRKDVVSQRYKKIFISVLILFFCVGSYFLYLYKKDSADGRLLIWKIATQMIQDQPFLGHGPGAFQAKYMLYQADYFMNNQNTAYEQLADNTKHPFNEFIKITIAYGLIGLVFVLLLLSIILWQISVIKSKKKILLLNAFTSIFLLSMVTYPLQYTVMQLFMILFLTALVPQGIFIIKKRYLFYSIRLGIVSFLCGIIYYLSNDLNAQMAWKVIAEDSIRTNDSKVLDRYKELYTGTLSEDPYFLYNYGIELYYYQKYDQSAIVLKRCKEYINDYDLQMVLADINYKKEMPAKALKHYELAGAMVPCRFLPLYYMFTIHKELKHNAKALFYARTIFDKKIKVDSPTIQSIREEVAGYIHSYDFDIKQSSVNN